MASGCRDTTCSQCVSGEFEPFFPAADGGSVCGGTLSCTGLTGFYRQDPKAQSQDTISFPPFTF